MEIRKTKPSKKWSGKPGKRRAQWSWRVWQVLPGGPAAEARLEVCFDFVVGINDTAPSTDQTFFQNVCELENTEVKLKVYNIRTHDIREVAITPRRWDGEGLLGAVLQNEKLDRFNFENAYAIHQLPPVRRSREQN